MEVTVQPVGFARLCAGVRVTPKFPELQKRRLSRKQGGWEEAL